jgi:hypothetical protein
MKLKTTSLQIIRKAALGLAALFLLMGYGGPASADCEAFPKIPLWKTLTHDFARQLVDEKYDGDWQAYIGKLERYESKLRGIFERGASADVTWKNRKIRLKGSAIPRFLKLVDRRISVTRCLAENRADNQDIANFSTAAGGTDGQYSDDPRIKQCAPIPNVKWWKFKTHESVSGYVSRKYRGNWGDYIKNWNRRLDKLQNIYGRGASAVTSTGIRLRGPSLADYMRKMQKRISITQCLSEKNGNARI